MTAYRQAVSKAVATLKSGGASEAVMSLPLLSPKDGSTYSIFRDTVMAAQEATYSFNQCKSDAETKLSLRKLNDHAQ